MTGASGVNASEQVVGRCVVDGIACGYVWMSDGSFLRFDVPFGPPTAGQIIGINDAGQIVGTYDGPDGKNHGYLRMTDDSYTTIDVPDAMLTQASGINNCGEIAGLY
jgi:hypothetical protein